MLILGITILFIAFMLLAWVISDFEWKETLHTAGIIAGMFVFVGMIILGTVLITKSLNMVKITTPQSESSQ